MSELNMEFKYVDVDQIRPNPFQPREAFVKESLQELANSIKNGGVIQPIIVRKNGATFEIIAGERRWRATQIAGLKQIPAIIKEIAENRVLLESLTENLHRLDLTDNERENAIHELWKSRDALNIETKSQLATAIGVKDYQINFDLDAWEFRRKSKMPMGVSTDVIRNTKGLGDQDRKSIIEKVAKEELKASEVASVTKTIKKGPKAIRKELLKSKSRITPKMAESIVEKLSSEEEQEAVLKEAIQHRLTEDEVEARIFDIKRSREKGIEPIVDRQIIIEGRWLINRITKPINDLLSINPDAFDDLDEVQKKDVIELIEKLENAMNQWFLKLNVIKIIDVGEQNDS